MPKYQVRAVVFKDGDWWIAQCLEYDLVSAARTLDDLKGELLAQLEFQVAYSLRSGREPFAGFRQGPARYWKMYEEVQSFAEDRGRALEL